MNHLSKLSTLALLALSLGATSACEPSSELEPEDVPSAEEFDALVLEARQQLLQTFTLDVGNLPTVEGEQGTRVSLPWWADFTDPTGAVVTGDVTLELIEIFDRGSMLVTNMPTNGRLPSGEPGQLISGGEHFVNVTKDGVSLEVNAEYYLEAPAEPTGGVDPGMSLFRAETEDGLVAGLEDDAVWVEDDSSPGNCCFNTEIPMAGYTVLSDQFGWTNIDRWMEDSRPKTAITVEVPPGFNSTNCVVYVTEHDQPNTLSALYGEGPDSAIFASGAYFIPVGLEMHVILVTVDDGEWSYGIQSLTVEGDDSVVFASAADLIVTDTQGMADAINDLP